MEPMELMVPMVLMGRRSFTVHQHQQQVMEQTATSLSEHLLISSMDLKQVDHGQVVQVLLVLKVMPVTMELMVPMVPMVLTGQTAMTGQMERQY